MIVRRLSIAGALSALVMTSALAGDAPPKLTPSAGPLDLADKFAFEHKPKKTRLAASGLACAGEGACLIAFDEGAEGRFVRLGAAEFRPLGKATFPASGGKDELDLEAAATDGSFYYVVGSHAVKRNDCADNPASRVLFRLPVDGKTGLGAGEPQPARPDLWSVMKAEPRLNDVAGVCLGTRPPRDAPDREGWRGLDIEGMAARDGRLFFGLRQPLEPTGLAQVFSVGAKAMFGEAGDSLAPKLDEVRVGDRRGVRDMAAVKAGILLLAGPDDDARDDDDPAEQGEPAAWLLLLWNTVDETPRVLGEFDLSDVKRRKDLDGCDDSRRPKLEGMAVVEDRPDGYRIVTVSDGLCDGGPMWFDVKR